MIEDHDKLRVKGIADAYQEQGEHLFNEGDYSCEMWIGDAQSLYRILDYVNFLEAIVPYDNTNKGALFKDTSESNRDYNGQLNVEGKEYWVSGWINTAGPNSKNPGSNYLSISLTPKDAPAQQTSADSGSDFDDDIPF